MRHRLVSAIACAALLLACGGGAGDGGPDPFTTDADGDGLSDGLEGSAQAVDTDGDGTPDFQDLDSDGDCRLDAVESGLATPPVDTDGDGRPDYRDRDSDADGLLDQAEDANCSGATEAGESDPLAADSDGDGAGDLVEAGAGTSPADPSDNPAATGDLVFLVPYQGAAAAPVLLDHRVRVRSLDLYVLLDRSGSMSAELTSVRDGLAASVGRLGCPPRGSGDPATCIPDLWAGAGSVGYAGGGADAFRHQVDVQPSPDFAAVPVTEPAGCCSEPLTFSIFAAITGQGGAGAPACGVPSVPGRATCAGSPASNAGHATFGYPCFREGALPVVLLATDEPPLSAGDTLKCPTWNTEVAPLLQARGARLMGLVGSGASAATVGDLRAMALATGAVDAANGDEPLVFDGADAGAASALEAGLRTLVAGVPLDLTVEAVDDPADAVQAVTAFLARLETSAADPLRCTDGLTVQDTNADTAPDQYLGVRVGTPVCWSLVPAANTTVPATAALQSYRVALQVLGDGVTTLDSREVIFLVPPLPAD